MKQNTRKNKTNQSVVWPTTAYFTIADLHNLNPKFVNITLRVRLTNAIEDGKVAEIGYVTGGKGRPPKVYSLTPVQQSTLNKVREDGMNLVDNDEKLVNVINVTTPTASAPTPTSTVSDTVTTSVN
jgi:hypothetical protein